jgi:pyruvate/2-oxoglutarate dehydrogenase complex dihydrolipoamide dehydrogenase (E3) component
VYAKAVVDSQTDRVVGLHYAGPNAGEVMQGFAVAMKMGLTKAVLDSTIGIHPTIAEDLTNMTVTK